MPIRIMSSITIREGKRLGSVEDESSVTDDLLFRRYIIPKAAATAKAAYPTKQVTTWAISQLDWSAGTRGLMVLLISVEKEAYAMIPNRFG